MDAFVLLFNKAMGKLFSFVTGLSTIRLKNNNMADAVFPGI